MIELLTARATVVTLAIIGAAASTLASVLQARNRIEGTFARKMTIAGYGCMGLSMLFFIIAGFRA